MTHQLCPRHQHHAHLAMWQVMVPNEEGLRFYDDLLSALEEAGITPYITLYHWDLPLALHQHVGGWHTPENERMVAEFVRYAELCFSRYAHRVPFWVIVHGSHNARPPTA
jgi:beta-glucosidase/6-phospho-beta-glucosidase/beta-galactosidase